MPYVVNTTEKDIELVFGGKPQKFPAKASVLVQDAALARWFCGKVEIPKSPADKRPAAVYPLIIADAPVGDVKQKVLSPKPPPPAPAAPSVQTAPTPNHVHAPDPLVQKAKSQRAMTDMSKEELIEHARKHGVFQKGMDRGRIIEKLSAIGFVPPAKF